MAAEVLLIQQLIQEMEAQHKSMLNESVPAVYQPGQGTTLLLFESNDAYCRALSWAITQAKRIIEKATHGDS